MEASLSFWPQAYFRLGFSFGRSRMQHEDRTERKMRTHADIFLVDSYFIVGVPY